MKTSVKEKTEEVIVRDSFKRVRKKESVFACCEVPLLGRSVDLMYIEDKQLIAVEFKLSNWRKALKQSCDHKLGADYAYICMPERNISETMREELREAGVGLTFYCEAGQWPFKTIIEAKKSKETWAVARSRTSAYIKNGWDNV